MGYRKRNKVMDDKPSNESEYSTESQHTSPIEYGSLPPQRKQKSRAAGIVSKRKATAQKDEVKAKRSTNQEKREAKAAQVIKKAENSPPPNNGRYVGRQLIRWNHNTDQLLLLTMHYECYRQGIQVPYDAIAKRMFAEKESTGASIVQHIGKLRLAALARGAWVPPLVGRCRKYVPLQHDIRGIVRAKYDGPPHITRYVEWNEDASMYISQEDIIAKGRADNNKPVYFKERTADQISGATAAARRAAGRGQTQIDTESEIEADPADMDGDAEYKPHEKDTSIKVEEENGFPSLFPPQPRLILILKAKPASLSRFPAGISGPDDDDYQAEDLWVPNAGQIQDLIQKESDTGCENNKSHGGKFYAYTGALSNAEQTAIEFRYADEIREAEEEYGGENEETNNYFGNDMTYSVSDTNFHQYGQNLMNNTWTSPQEMNQNHTYGGQEFGPLMYHHTQNVTSNTMMTEFNTHEPSGCHTQNMTSNAMMAAFNTHEPNGHYVQRNDGLVDQPENHVNESHSLGQESNGFVGHEALLQQPYQGLSMQNKHIINHNDENQTFCELSSQGNGNPEIEFHHQPTTPNHVSELLDYLEESQAEDRTYQGDGYSDNVFNEWQYGVEFFHS